MDERDVCTTTFVRVRGGLTALQETLLRGYGDHTPTPLRSFRAALFTVFVLSMLKVRSVDRHSMRCCGDACDRAARTLAIYIFLGRGWIAVGTLRGCARGLGTALISYTVIISIASFLWYIGKQCRPRSDAECVHCFLTECSI